MKKEELVQKMKQNGWDVTFENRYGIFKIKIKRKNSILEFSCYKIHYAYRISIHAEGEEKIKEEDFCAILEFLKKDKPILFTIYEAGISYKWERIIREYLKKEMYEKVDLYKDGLNEILNIPKEYTLYMTKDSIKKIDILRDYYLTLEEVFNKNYSNELFFDFDKRNDYVDFFVNINYFLCTIKLSIVDNLLELNIFKMNTFVKKWIITKKEDVELYVQSFIDEIKQKQRVRNLFETSTYFFDKYCILNGIINDDKEEIYDALRAYYIPKEIEQISVTFYKAKEKRNRIFDKNNNYICFFDEKVIVVSREEKTVTIVENQEEINRHIEEIKKNIS